MGIEQLRVEGWSKHIGKNGKDFWAVIGDAKLSTWTRPKPGGEGGGVWLEYGRYAGGDD